MKNSHIGWCCPASPIGSQVYSMKLKSLAIVKKIRYKLALKELYRFYPIYLVENATSLVWDDNVMRANYTDDELLTYGPPAMNDSLPGVIGIIGLPSGMNLREMNDEIYVALDDPLYNTGVPALRIFTNFVDMLNWNTKCSLSIFENEYFMSDNTNELSSEEVNKLMVLLNQSVEAYWISDLDEYEYDTNGYSWNIAERKYLRSLPKITVWHQLIFEYNERMKYSDKKDFLDISMPIPDYTTLKTRNQ